MTFTSKQRDTVSESNPIKAGIKSNWIKTLWVEIESITWQNPRRGCVCAWVSVMGGELTWIGLGERVSVQEVSEKEENKGDALTSKLIAQLSHFNKESEN